MLHFKQDQLTVFQSALYKTTTAIIETDEAIILTDPNWLPEEVTQIKAYINNRLGHKQLYIILTHSDFDHLIGVGAFPNAKIIASDLLAHHENKDQIVKEMNDFDQTYYLTRDYTHQFPKVDEVIKTDGQQLQLGDTNLTFYLAPGHTKDGLFTLIEPQGIFLAGDYLSDVEFPFIEDSYSAYVNTMEKMATLLKQHTIHYLVPGHGHVTDDDSDMSDRLNGSTHYLKQLRVNPDQLENECRKRYPFFEAMKSSHVTNVKRATNEFD